MDSATTAPRRDLQLLRSFATRIDRTDASAHNNLGVLYHNAGLFDEAVEAFTRALALDPRMDVAQRNFEVASLQSGRAEARAAQLREHLQRHPRDVEARWELGRTCALLGDHTEALAQFDGILQLRPGDAGVLIQLGLSHKALDEIDQAQQAFERALAADPDSSVVRFYLAEIEYNRGLNARAIELLHAALERNPRNHEAWHLLGFVLGDEGRAEEARAATRRALELNPDLARAEANLALPGTPTMRYVDKARRESANRVEMHAADDSPLTHLMLGLAFRKRGYYAEALAAYEQARQRGENPDQVDQAIAEVHLLRRAPEPALALYETLVERHPGNAKLWNERGVALHECGRFMDALASYERAVTLDPACGVGLNNAGVARYHAGDADTALACFRDAIAVAPRLAKARLNEALLLFQRKSLQPAIEAYQRALELGTEATTAVAWNGIGLVLVELGRDAEARAAFARAIEARPRHAAAHYNLSFTLSRLGDFDGAMRENAIALEIEPYYVPQRFELALDPQFDDAQVAVETDLGGGHRVDAGVSEFAFDVSALDSLFSNLRGEDGAGAGHHATPAESDPYALARDFLSKGLLDRAHAEAARAMARGADAGAGATLLGDVFSRRRLWGEALERYREARRAAPGSAAAKTGEATALVRLGRGAEARALAEEILAASPADVETLLLAASARVADGDPRSALHALELARTRAPERADVHRQIGDVVLELGDRPAAIGAYQKALARDPGSTATRLVLARAFASARQWTDAERELRVALAAEPGHAEATLELARLCHGRGASRDAMLLLVDLLQRDPYHFDAMILLGEALLDLQRPVDALIAIARVLRFHPAHAGALFHEGVVLARLHRVREAAERWRRVIGIEPAGEYGLRARRELRAIDPGRRLEPTGTGGG